jgi:hypothetical protein
MKKAAVIVLLFGLAVAVPAGAQTVDCLVAIVNGQAVTLTDLRIASEFGLFGQESADRPGERRLAVLNALIDQKVVLGVAREPVTVSGEDLDRALEALRDKLGPGAFEKKLQTFGLIEKDLDPLLADQIRYDKAVANRFSFAIPVSASDAEQYYREVYVPEQKAQGLAPEPFEKALTEVGNRLREELRAKKVSEWVKGLRAQAEVRINKDCLAAGGEDGP